MRQDRRVRDDAEVGRGHLWRSSQGPTLRYRQHLCAEEDPHAQREGRLPDYGAARDQAAEDAVTRQCPQAGRDGSRAAQGRGQETRNPLHGHSVYGPRPLGPPR